MINDKPGTGEERQFRHEMTECRMLAEIREALRPIREDIPFEELPLAVKSLVEQVRNLERFRRIINDCSIKASGPDLFRGEI